MPPDASKDAVYAAVLERPAHVHVGPEIAGRGAGTSPADFLGVARGALGPGA